MFQIKKPRIRFFAPWAIINKPFTTPKHYVGKNNLDIVYDKKFNTDYANHIEMAGFYTSAIISYGASKNGELKIMRHVTYPTLRKYPNDTHSSLDNNFNGVNIIVDNKKKVEIVDKFIFNGKLHILSSIEGVSIERILYPANCTRALIEEINLNNTSNSDVNIKIDNLDKFKTTLACHGHNRQKYNLFNIISDSEFTIKANSKAKTFIAYCGSYIDEKVNINFEQESKLRDDFINKLDDCMIVNTPNETINLMAIYAKIRSSESIFKTKAGLMHSPGGGGYYAAIWTNDQCEYVNPLFGYLGYDIGEQQSINSYEMYRKYISSDKALITSIIAEGDGIWHGAKDRGDSAMYAYGLSRFLLTYGDKELVSKFIDLIDKCLEFTISQINEDGVVKSDSDELENRFESGKANLCTSTLAYDALLSASYLHKDIGNVDKCVRYTGIANKLKENIVKYFSKTVESYNTYMYCKEEQNLRSWIAMPMVVGIFDRAKATKDALLSPKLRLAEGMLTRSGEKTFWDRSTLYALRGLFNAGFSDESLELLEKFSTARLLGEHIPYAVEAFPEGNQAQLSAESGLYLRIFTEGILGMRPVGLGKISITPHLPKCWNYLEIKHIKIANKIIDIKVEKEKSKYLLTLTINGNVVSQFDGKEFVIEL